MDSPTPTIENKKWPVVTAFTLIYNTGKHVLEAIKSIRSNNYPNLQHIIIDDCSTDGISAEMVENYIKKEKYDCQFIKHKENWGICKSLNQVLDLTEGEYLFGCSDDLIAPDSIRKLVLKFQSLPPNYKIVYGDVGIIDAENKIIHDSYFAFKKLDLSSEVTFYTYLTRKNRFCTFGTMYRVDVFDIVGKYDEELSFEDVDMHLRILKKFKASYCDSLVGYYRSTPEQISRNIPMKYFDDQIKIAKKFIDHSSVGVNNYLISEIIKLAELSFIKNTPNHENNLSYAKSLSQNNKSISILFQISQNKFLASFFRKFLNLKMIFISLTLEFKKKWSMKSEKIFSRIINLI